MRSLLGALASAFRILAATVIFLAALSVLMVAAWFGASPETLRRVQQAHDRTQMALGGSEKAAP